MATPKRLGIYMDHSSAHLMELTAVSIKTKVITSKATHLEKDNRLKRSEILMHYREQHEQAEYYKELSNVIKEYTLVVLFGPTDAKTELYNILKADHHFDKIKIEVKSTDYMTENEEYAFVRNYFK